ncbi:MAG TPA: lantibiotic dehydratase C-terminal domain-containing protein [Candidatus Angelobacter sp.]|nr:lantibiotic dehydratase C-terminal domain-containing protein [Candidatus Angelobacter sp.]
MDEWRSFHVYYTNPDRILLECIAPLLRSFKADLNLCFWERHYAGGPHIRARFKGDDPQLTMVEQRFVTAVESYLAEFPSVPVSSYSAEDARRLLEVEGEAYQRGDLEYRVNVIRPCTYQRLNSHFIQGPGLQFLHEFLHDSNPVSEAILKDSAAKRNHLLRMYFLNALVSLGSLARGSVSFKSHWSGFAAAFPNNAATQRIRDSFEKQQHAIIAAMLEVQRRYDSQDFSGDPILQEWHTLLQRYREKSLAILQAGEPIGLTIGPEEIRKYRDSLANQNEPNEFIQVLLKDERFVASFHHEKALAGPRALTNLLYMIIPTVGLTVLDRMAFCYYAHRAVETYFQCDLTDVLRETIAVFVGGAARTPAPNA